MTYSAQATTSIDSAVRIESHLFNSLSKLKIGDTIKLEYHSRGCFYYEDEMLIIYKENQMTVAELQSGRNLHRVSLSKSQIRAFNRFENKLRVLKDNYDCTTVDTYILISKSLALKRTEGRCSWNGFDRLTKSLFGEVK